MYDIFKPRMEDIARSRKVRKMPLLFPDGSAFAAWGSALKEESIL
jgi:hypothetical protein